ncbi:hypothetical protein [Halovenus halobia]|uniref:hypothetical protein n=1 Tax=Halovenus halobia TaxID=3396622 RepID=UPI003F54A641
MRAVLRFWVSVLSLLVSVSAVGYLFLSFLFPERALVLDSNTVRLGVMFVALAGTGTLVWAAVFSEVTQRPGSGAQKP